jgi:hypothetical protein
LELAWRAVNSEVKGVPMKDGAEMALAVITAAMAGEKDFQRLQQHAIDVLTKRGVVLDAKPQDRRKSPRAGPNGTP